MTPKRTSILIIIVLIAVFGGRLGWIHFWKFGEGRYLDSPDKRFRAAVSSYSRSAFWGGLTVWTEFKIEKKSKKEIWSKRLFHSGFELQWRAFGNIEWVNPTTVKFKYSSSKNKSNLKELEVTINIDRDII